ncbi:hypothetical protein [Sodalis sp. RH20]|uniref:hypothetical protein n=1 Tax=unclassified Sodalis (in: enterobacteria) TaxID=2636512 RepID=UPI0039B390C1
MKFNFKPAVMKTLIEHCQKERISPAALINTLVTQYINNINTPHSEDNNGKTEQQ